MIAPTLTCFIQAIAKIRQLRLSALPPISSLTMLPRERCNVLVLVHEWRVWPLIRISGMVHIGVLAFLHMGDPCTVWFRQKSSCLVSFFNGEMDAVIPQVMFYGRVEDWSDQQHCMHSKI